MIQLIVNHSLTRVIGHCPPLDIIKKPLHYTEKVYVSGGKRSKMAAMAKSSGKNFNPNQPIMLDKHLYDDFTDSFPTGMLPKVMQLLDQYQFAYEVNDLRSAADDLIKIGARTGKYFDKRPRDYQERAIDAAIDKKRGIIRIACGGGKTLCAGEIMRNLKRRTVFLVNRGGLLYQAKEVFEQMLGQDIGQVGDGIIDIKEVNVVMIQTLVRHLGKKYEVFDEEDSEEDNTDVQGNAQQIQEMLNSTDVIFMDECHCIGAQTAFDCINAFSNAQWRIGLSATPVREDGKDIFFEACFGPKISDISFTYLIEHGFLARPHICFVKLNGNILPKANKARFNTIYNQAIVNHDFRNRMAILESMALVANGHKPMTLVQQIKHGNLLRSFMSNSEFIHGAHSIAKRKEVLAQFCEGKIPSIIATTIMDEAIDIPACDAVIMAGGGASYARTIQRISRCMRLDPDNPKKQDCIIIDFFDEDKFLDRHCRVRQTTYMSEKAFKIVLPGQTRHFDVF